MNVDRQTQLCLCDLKQNPSAIKPHLYITIPRAWVGLDLTKWTSKDLAFILKCFLPLLMIFVTRWVFLLLAPICYPLEGS